MFLLKKYLTTKLDLSTSIALIAVFFLLFSLPFSLNFFRKEEEVSKFDIVRAEGAKASLTLSASPAQTIDVPFDMLILLNTDGRAIKKVDVVVDYDPSYLNLVDVIPIANFTTTLKTFMPTKGDDSFDKEKVISETKKLNKITFSVSTLEQFNGTTQLAILRFKPIKVGNTNVSFAFTPGALGDTNILTHGADSFDLLHDTSQLTNANISVLAK